jgi:hypothetical protein
MYPGVSISLLLREEYEASVTSFAITLKNFNYMCSEKYIQAVSS